jgi:hypothetical protein
MFDAQGSVGKQFTRELLLSPHPFVSWREADWR